MRTAAILCPGPSLDRVYFPSHRPYDLIIGINEAASHYPCDYACFGDIEGIPQHSRFLTTQEMVSLHPDKVAWKCAYKWDDLVLPRSPAQCNYSSVVALSFILQTEPDVSEIDMYGCDMRSSDRAFGGYIEEDPARWVKELEDLKMVLPTQARSRIVVRRITSFQEMTR